MELCVGITEYMSMESQGSVLLVGQPAIASRLETTLDAGTLTTRETAAAALEYLDATTEPIDCVVTGHDPPESDCFQLLTASLGVPVVVAVSGGSSELATDVNRQGAARYIDLSTLDDEIGVLASAIRKARSSRSAGARTSGSDTSSGSTAQLATNRDHVEEFMSIISHELRTPGQKANSGLDLALIHL